MNSATLVLLGIYHGQANPDRLLMDDIDKLIILSTGFHIRYGKTKWKDSDIVDWVDTLAYFYNANKEDNWKEVPMAGDKIQAINNRNARMLETVADIAYMAGVDRYYSGNSRADIQEFISLANKFEDEHEGVDWDAEASSNDDDRLDYMEAIEEFYKENVTVVKKLDFNYPNGTLYPWDNIEIAGCIEEDGQVSRVDDGDDVTPTFYTVYLHQIEGGTMAVADLPTLKEAQAVGDLIHNAVISFKNNGYMPLNRNAKLHRQFNLFLDERINVAHTDQTKAAYETVKHQFNSLVKA